MVPNTTTPAAPLLRKNTSHETPPPLPSTPELPSIEKENVLNHLAEHLGEGTLISRELLSPGHPLDIYLFPANSARPFETLVTLGCSDKQLKAPKGLEQYRYVEQVLCLPQGWPMPTAEPLAAELRWPFEALKSMVQVPRKSNSFLGHGHTIPNSEMAQLFAGTSFNCVLLDQALIGEIVLPDIHYPNGQILTFLGAFPITEKETQFKIENGHEALVTLMQSKNLLSPTVNINRPCLAEACNDGEWRSETEESSSEISELMEAAILETGRLYHQRKLSMSKSEIKSFKGKKPGWLKRDKTSKLNQVFDHSEALRLHGQVVWGHIIQANQLLFDPEDTTNCPAAIVYSLDPYFNAHPVQLGDIASGLFDIKGSATDPELQRFSDLLADETEVQMHLPIPESLTGGKQVIYTTIMVQRHHLPTKHLSASLFPLLAAPQHTFATAILPCDFWGENALAIWLSMSSHE